MVEMENNPKTINQQFNSTGLSSTEECLYSAKIKDIASCKKVLFVEGHVRNMSCKHRVNESYNKEFSS